MVKRKTGNPAARNRAKLQAMDDPTARDVAKRLTALRREIHNRLGRMERIREVLRLHEEALDKLECEARRAEFALWSDSPRLLEQLNRDHKRWRRR
jgi:hypothetical protein